MASINIFSKTVDNFSVSPDSAKASFLDETGIGTASFSSELYSRLAVSSSWMIKDFSTDSTVLDCLDSSVISVVSTEHKIIF